MSRTGVLLKDRRCGAAERCEESATPFQGADSRVVKVFQGYAKNAYPWLTFPAPLRGVKCPNSRAPLRGAEASVLSSTAPRLELPHDTEFFFRILSGSTERRLDR